MRSVAGLSEVVRQIVNEKGLSQTELARRLDVTQQAVSEWLGDRSPRLERLVAIEKALELPRGTLLVAAGYVEGVDSVEHAITADPDLGPFKESLRAAYRAFRDQARAAQST